MHRAFVACVFVVVATACAPDAVPRLLPSLPASWSQQLSATDTAKANAVMATHLTRFDQTVFVVGTSPGPVAVDGTSDTIESESVFVAAFEELDGSYKWGVPVREVESLAGIVAAGDDIVVAGQSAAGGVVVIALDSKSGDTKQIANVGKMDCPTSVVLKEVAASASSPSVVTPLSLVPDPKRSAEILLNRAAIARTMPSPTQILPNSK